MHIFHRWSKWEQYTWSGTVTYTGLLVPKSLQGSKIAVIEYRQKRKCSVCGKVEDEELTK